MSRTQGCLCILYVGILLALAPVNLLSFDTYYYWAWSRHLALSYFDGSPMIAYFIKASTFVFGDTLFALSVVGIVSVALTSFILYKTARHFLTPNASFMAMSLWLFSPLVTIDLLRQTTYDTPLTLFWALTLYAVVSWLTSPRTLTLYAIGACIGLMQLSKYSGCVLVLALLIFIGTSSERRLFKNFHFYGAIGLALLLFSPVIWWNAQQGWLSFHYQLTTHVTTAEPWGSLFKSFMTVMLPALNWMLLPSMICLKRFQHTSNMNIVRMLMTVCITFFVFYLLLSMKVTLRAHWLTPYLISSALLGGVCFERYAYRKSAYALQSVYVLISLSILINNTIPFHVTNPQKWQYYQAIQALNRAYPTHARIIVTSGWLESRMLFFLKDKPNVVTLGCGAPENQYALWSPDVVEKIKNKTIKTAWYIDMTDHLNCVASYFDRCVPLQGARMSEGKLVAYVCTND